jgi:ketosteroid isomerase-like protein
VLIAPNNNVHLVEDAYAAFARGDIQYILDRITEDVDWINEGPASIPYAGAFKGPQQLQQFFQGLGSTVEDDVSRQPSGLPKAKRWSRLGASAQS